MKTKVLCAFPGLGKSYATRHFADEFKMKDSDSSEFHYLEGLDGKTTNPDWPKNYLKHIREILKSEEYDFLFVSTHAEVREGLHLHGVPYVLVIPHNTPQVKAEFLKRYRERGSSEKFVALLDRMWNEWTNRTYETRVPGSVVMFHDDHLDREFLRRVKESHTR